MESNTVVTGAAWDDADLQAMISKQARESSTTLPEKYRLLSTTSSRIRAMFADGYKPMAIAKMLSKRPQHVYNVLRQPLKKS